MESKCRLKEESPAVWGFVLMTCKGEAKRVCEGCNYTIDECPLSNIISVGFQHYTIVKKQEKLPATLAWCRDCAKNQARPIAWTYMNGRPAIILECIKCHSRYVLYEDAYKRKYTGYKNGYGEFIAPGQNPRNVISAKREKSQNEHDQFMMVLLGVDEQGLKEKREKIAADEAKFSAKRRAEEAESRYDYAQEKLEAKSNERKQLIAEGVLVYNKAAKALVDTRTGEIVKL